VLSRSPTCEPTNPTTCLEMRPRVIRLRQARARETDGAPTLSVGPAHGTARLLRTLPAPRWLSAPCPRAGGAPPPHGPPFLPDRGLSSPCYRVDTMAALPRDVMEGFRAAGELHTEHKEVSTVLSLQDAASNLCDGGVDTSLGEWLIRVIGVIRKTEPSAGSRWANIEHSLLSFSSAFGADGVHGGDSRELLDVAELADLIDICGQGYRAARHSRDLIGRFSEESVDSGSFFRDVRMTPTHFDEVVALTAPHLPRGRRGPAALPPTWRAFAVLFWFAQGGRQRVVARAVDVAESTF